jgi:hypothetical protein
MRFENWTSRSRTRCSPFTETKTTTTTISASVVTEANYHSRSTVLTINRCVQRLIFRPSLLYTQPHHKSITATRNKSINAKTEITRCAYLPCLSMPIELTRLKYSNQLVKNFPRCGTRVFIALVTRLYLFSVFIA